MSKIATIYVVNHTHHDIGFNDYQDVCFRQHGEFIHQALDLIEATADRPGPSRYRWVCEVTGPLVRYLRRAGEEEVSRFRHWQQAGAIDIAAMHYNLTPMLNPEQMHRSLYPVRALREEFGLTVQTAMQDDVNGVSWLFADLLPAIGVDFFTMAANQYRGRAPRPFPGGFWWQGPGGGRLLTWNGFHYLFGRSQAKLGDWRFVDESLPYYLKTLEQDADYPFDFLYCEATHPMRVDNGPPDERMADFVDQWNSEGREPRIEFTTPRGFRDLLLADWADQLPTRRGDWTDWWCDGVASGSYETGVNRLTHELIGAAESLAAWLRAEGHADVMPGELIEQVYETMTLFDEHTWGAFSSIDAPTSLLTRAQWNRKAGFAYEASMQTHDVLTRTSRRLADTLGSRGPEGRFNLGDLDAEAAYPHAPDDELLVVNTLPWARELTVEVPEHRGGGAPAGMLESFFPRGVPWGGPPPSQLKRVSVSVPGFGYAFVSTDAGLDDADLRAEGNVIENDYYRVVIDPVTGGLASWVDKELAHDFAGEHHGWRIGQYVYETVDSGEGRNALFVPDFADWDFGHWKQDPPLRRAVAETVTVHPARVHEGSAFVDVDIDAPGVHTSTCRFALEPHTRSLQVDWVLDKIAQLDPESVYFAFPFALDGADFTVDLNGVPCTPNDDQLLGGVFDWYPVRHWVDVSDGRRGVTVVPLDAPLVQLGGITTGKIAEQLDPEGPTVMSWALNNHWPVNFKASQDGEIPQRYRLTTHAGSGDTADINRYATCASTPPIVLRDYVHKAAQSGQFLSVPESLPVEISLHPATDGDGVIVRARNLSDGDLQVPLTFAVPVLGAESVSPLEENGEILTVTDNTVTIRLGHHQMRNARIRFEGR